MHTNYRRKTGEILVQLATALWRRCEHRHWRRSKEVLKGTLELGLDIETRLRKRDYVVLGSPVALDTEAIANTGLFHIMMSAFAWDAVAPQGRLGKVVARVMDSFRQDHVATNR